MMKILGAAALAAVVCACSAETADPLTSGDGGAGGDGGAAPMPCTYDVDCPGPDDRSTCVHRVCEAGVCGLWFAPEGRPEIDDLIRGDCAAFECDGAGKFMRVEDAEDVPDDGNGCTVDACADGEPVHTAKAEGTACSVGARDSNGQCVASD
jgi:hypothetical protein